MHVLIKVFGPALLDLEVAIDRKFSLFSQKLINALMYLTLYLCQ
jgi:hypothetical protein